MMNQILHNQIVPNFIVYFGDRRESSRISQQQVESTQFAPDIVIPVGNIWIYQDLIHELSLGFCIFCPWSYHASSSWNCG